jgi:hypothetical protein
MNNKLFNVYNMNFIMNIQLFIFMLLIIMRLIIYGVIITQFK